MSPTAAYLGLVDTANGIVVREDPRTWMFPNVDLTVHLFRAPEAGWVGFDTTVTFGSDGLGLTSSTPALRLGMYWAIVLPASDSIAVMPPSESY